MERSESIATLAGALAKAQSDMKAAAKDSVNPHFRSRYADLTSIWEACRAPLSKNGLSVTQLPEDAGDGRIGLTSILMHSSGEWISGRFSIAVERPTAQAIGSALTYLRRYGLAALVGVVSDEDDDGNGASRAARLPEPEEPEEPPAQGEREHQDTPPKVKAEKMATVKTGQWQKAAKRIAKDVPHYANGDGSPNFVHILKAALAEGFAEVTDANLEPLIEALGKRAASRAEAK